MIKEVNEIPVSKTEKYKTRRQLLREDIEYAWNNGILRFSFEGYEDWKYLRNYAREVANNFFARMIRKESCRIHKELQLCKYNFAHSFFVPTVPVSAGYLGDIKAWMYMPVWDGE